MVRCLQEDAFNPHQMQEITSNRCQPEAKEPACLQYPQHHDQVPSDTKAVKKVKEQYAWEHISPHTMGVPQLANLADRVIKKYKFIILMVKICYSIAFMLIFLCLCCCFLQAMDKYGADALFGRLPTGPIKPREMNAPLERISLPSASGVTTEQQQQQQRMSRASCVKNFCSSGGAAAARGLAVGGSGDVLFSESGGLLHSPVPAIIRTSAVFPERFGIPGQGEFSGQATPANAGRHEDEGKRSSSKKSRRTAESSAGSESRSRRKCSSSSLVQHGVHGYQPHVNPMFQPSSQSEHLAQISMYALTPRISEEESTYATPRQSDDGGDEYDHATAGASAGCYADYASSHSTVATAPITAQSSSEQQLRGSISRQTSQHSKWKMPSKLLLASNNKAASISSSGAQMRAVSSSIGGIGCHHEQQLQHLKEGTGVRATAALTDLHLFGEPASLYHLDAAAVCADTPTATANITVHRRSWGTQVSKSGDLQGDDDATGVMQKKHLSWLSRVCLALSEAWRVYQDDGAGGDGYQQQEVDPSMDAASLFWFKKPTLVLKVRMDPGSFCWGSYILGIPTHCIASCSCVLRPQNKGLHVPVIMLCIQERSFSNRTHLLTLLGIFIAPLLQGLDSLGDVGECPCTQSIQ